MFNWRVIFEITTLPINSSKRVCVCVCLLARSLACLFVLEMFNVPCFCAFVATVHTLDLELEHWHSTRTAGAAYFHIFVKFRGVKHLSSCLATPNCFFFTLLLLSRGMADCFRLIGGRNLAHAEIPRFAPFL